MKQIEERYISLLTDFGFKRIFGTAMNKDLLICFLNSLFGGKQVVKDVKYLNAENVGDVYTDRKAIFDVYCEGENGEKFIVEMQNAYQTYFKDRSLFYRVFYDKLEFIYVEIAKFNKSLDELETLYDKWLFALKNLYKLNERPKALRDKVFDRLFEEAEIARFTKEELREYEASIMAYRDIKNSIDTAEKIGIEKGKIEIVKAMLAGNMPIEQIMQFSGLTREKIEQLKK